MTQHGSIWQFPEEVLNGLIGALLQVQGGSYEFTKAQLNAMTDMGDIVVTLDEVTETLKLEVRFESID
jgi:hypothetical protein